MKKTYLGVVFNKKQTWKPQIQMAETKGRHTINKGCDLIVSLAD